MNLEDNETRLQKLGDFGFQVRHLKIFEDDETETDQDSSQCFKPRSRLRVSLLTGSCDRGEKRVNSYSIKLKLN